MEFGTHEAGYGLRVSITIGLPKKLPQPGKVRGHPPGRIASDADHWHHWLERLAELRRASDGDEALHMAATKVTGRLLSAAEATPPSTP
jgi:hypothetical protein